MSEPTIEPTRSCQGCEGAGKHVFPAFRGVDGKLWPERTSQCHVCKGVGTVDVPEWRKIIEAIRGQKPGKLRSKRPEDRRAYYVWRMARFHGGADVTMPMTAAMTLGKDAYLPELDALSEHVAKLAFGTDLAGAHRWGTALGILDGNLAGLPASAYSAGPVADADKPEEEAPELT